jgi:hypothetical protein
MILARATLWPAVILEAQELWLQSEDCVFLSASCLSNILSFNGAQLLPVLIRTSQKSGLRSS